MNVTNQIKKLGLILIFLFSCSELAFAQSYQGQEGNGGGGVYRNGRYMTFYSAGFFTELSSMAETEIPSLDETVNAILKIPGLKKNSKAKYLKALLPSDTREYYRVLSDEFSDEVYDRLIAEYRRITGAPEEGLVLFAVTDSSSKTTYLLPSFYELSTFEQMAILFHEAYWLVNPRSSYKKVVNAEVIMQAYFENTKNRKKIIKALEIVGSTVDVLSYVVKRDIKRKALKRLTSGKRVSLKKLLGEDCFNCLKQYKFGHCKDLWRYRVFELQRKYSRSLLLKNLNKLQFTHKNGKSLEDSFSIPNQYLDSAYLYLELPEYETCLRVVGKTEQYSHSTQGLFGRHRVYADADYTLKLCVK